MREVDIATVGSEIARHMKAAEEGETVLLTDHGRVVARLVPEAAPVVAVAPEVERYATEEAMLADLEAKGVLTRAPRPRGPVPQGIGLVPLAQLLADLDRDREDRF